jgi:hypothetical protein
VIIKHFFQPWKTADFLKLFHAKKIKYFFWLIWMLLVAPVPAALTLDDVPNIHRTVVMSIFLAIVFAAAWKMLDDVLIWKKKIPIILVTLVFLAESVYFLNFYFFLHSLAATPYRTDEQRTLGSWLLQNHSSYEYVYAPANEAIVIHYLFLKKDFSKSLVEKFSKGLQVENVDNIFFIDTFRHCPSEVRDAMSTKGSVTVDRSECKQLEGYKTIDTIQHLDLTDAYALRVLDPEFEQAEREKNAQLQKQKKN